MKPYGVGALMLVAAACTTQERPLEMRQWTDDLAFRISVTPTPPVSEIDAVYKVVVQDKKTGQPIETGRGRIFASNKDQASTYDGLAKGKEPGTYYARLRFPVGGDWALGMQFKRDSAGPLERTQDWIQTVLKAPALGAESTKTH